MTNMIDVHCRDCGAELGAQGGDEIDWSLWVHTRCPVRTARNLGISDDEYAELFRSVHISVRDSFPDFPMNEVDDPRWSGIRTLRADIAAGVILEHMSRNWKVVKSEA